MFWQRGFMDYDVLVLGGGIIGCAAAYELSKYSLNIALIEKDYDIADDVSLINSAIIYDGVDCEDALMAKLEHMGNELIEDLTTKFKVPYKKCPTLMIARDSQGEAKLDDMYKRAIERGIDNIVVLDSAEVYKLEPNLNMSVKKGLYSSRTGVIYPYDLAIAYGEIAFDNGVNFKLGEEVIDIQKISRGFRVVTNKNKFTCKMVLNTTPSQNYTIDSSERDSYKANRSNLKYLVLDKEYKGGFSNIVAVVDATEGAMYSVPTAQGNTIVSISSKEKIDTHSAVAKANSFLSSNLDRNNINSIYHSTFYQDNILIDDSYINGGYIKVTGKHYGQVTMTPAIAKMVCETIVDNMGCRLKKDFVDKRRDFYRFRELSNKERINIIKEDSKYGKMICVCNNVTEGEIVDSIRRPLGARTVEGVKRRTGVMLGNCQGAYCINKIVAILSREMNKSMTDIVQDSKNSKVVPTRIKEFDGV